jgi:molybdopterin synthase catalytic subunit
MEIVVDQPIKPDDVFGLLQKEAGGSVILHYAIVRVTTEGKTTTSVSYTANGDIQAELKAISAELREKWKLEDILLIRRLGQLSAGSIISLAAVCSPRSEAAFEACRYGVERLKRMSTVVKNEVFS